MGVLTVEFAALERVITILIRYCSSISTENEVACLVGSDQLDALCKKFEKLVHINLKDEPTLLAQFQSLRAQLFSINEERNKYIHSLWQIPALSILSSEPYVERRKYFRVFNSAKGLEDIEPVPLAKLYELISKITDTATKLSNFVFDNLKAIRAAIERRKDEAVSRLTGETTEPQSPDST